MNLFRFQGEKKCRQRSSDRSASSTDSSMFCDDLILETRKLSQIALVWAKRGSSRYSTKLTRLNRTFSWLCLGGLMFVGDVLGKKSFEVEFIFLELDSHDCVDSCNAS